MNEKEKIANEKIGLASKTLDRARILPIIGLALLIPPVANIFQLRIFIAGIPFTTLYLFVVWGLLIASAAFLSRRLQEGDSTLNPSGQPEK